MEASHSLSLALPRPAWPLRVRGSQLAGAGLSFATVTYLALSDGGYDVISRSQVGLLAWWLVLLAAFAGVLPRRLGRAGWLALALMVGFAGWTGASIGWSLSAQRSADALGMVATYAGVFMLALTVQGRSAARHAVAGAGAAVGVIGLLAVLSRLHPAWFPADPHLTFFADASRLSYPLGYWNGLAAFLAMGVPLLLAAAGGARRIAVGALAAAVIPVLVLGIYLANSRGGAIALGVAVAAYVLLSPDRLQTLATLTVAGLGSGVLVSYADRHAVIRAGLDTAAARAAGDRMLVVVALACAGVAMLVLGIGLAARHAERPRWLAPPRRTGAIRVAGVLIVLVLAATALGAPGRLASDWRNFKAPVGVVSVPGGGADLFSRLSSPGGNSRYQYWVQAVKADQTGPLIGIGAGTFDLWWAPHATAAGHITDAHSLYMQTLAETGIVGLGMIGGLLLCLLVAGVWRALRAPPELRLALAGASAGVAAFATSAAYEWVWQLGALATLALILGAVCVAGREPAIRSARVIAAEQAGGATADASTIRASGGTRRGRTTGASGGARQGRRTWAPGAARRGRRRWVTGLPRVAVVLVSVAAMIAVGLPLAVAGDLAASRTAAARGQLSTALADAKAAHRVQPYAAGPLLQEGLVLEQAGALQSAQVAVAAATRQEPTNWQPWLILARIESELGNRGPALADFRRARRRDPLGAVFNP